MIEESQVRCPVCGMIIEPTEAFASREYEGQTYYFDTRECLEDFDRSPEKYIHAAEGGSPHH